MWLDNYYKLVYAHNWSMSRYITGNNDTTTYYWVATDLSHSPIKCTKGTSHNYVGNNNSSADRLGVTYTPINGVYSQTSKDWGQDTTRPNLVVGSGTTSATPSDCRLESEITSLSSVIVATSHNPSDGTITYEKTMKNTASNAISVSEIGLVICAAVYPSASSTSNTKTPFLVYREVLDTPITVGPGENFTVSITHQFTMPG